MREDESLSLHRYITFDVGSSSTVTIQPSRGWASSKIEATQLKATLTRVADPLPETAAAGTAADSLVEWMTHAADSCLPKRQQGNGRFPVPWWSELIGSLRKECLRARRQFQRKRSRLGEDRSREYEETWKGKRKQLALAIKEAKEKCWSNLIATVDKDPWGKPYKIVMKRLRRQRPIPWIQLPGRVDNIIDALFPTAPNRTPSTVHCTSVEPPTPFSMAELTTAARSLPNGKAPGPDGLSNEIIKMAVSVEPQWFLRTYNACLASGKFPDRKSENWYYCRNQGNLSKTPPHTDRYACSTDAANYWKKCWWQDSGSTWTTTTVWLKTNMVSGVAYLL